MPEFRHYTFFDETIAILRDVSATHALKMIPEQPVLAEPRLEPFDRFEPEVATRLARFGVVELEVAFTRHPLQFKQRDGGSAVLGERPGVARGCRKSDVAARRQPVVNAGLAPRGPRVEICDGRHGDVAKWAEVEAASAGTPAAG